MKRKKSEVTDDVKVSTVEELVQTAADLVGPLAQAAADRLEAAAGRVGPLAHGAADRLEPMAHNLAGRVAPFAQQAGATVGPYAVLARQRAVDSAHDIIERWRPTLEEAMERVSPGIEAARDRINEELLPKLIASLEAAAAAPMVQEMSQRGQATLAAARGELALPTLAALPEQPAPKKKSRWVKRVLIVTAVGGVVVFVARKLLAGQDADWQAARPTAPYTPSKPPTTAPSAAPASNAHGADADTRIDEAPVAAEGLTEQEPPEATPVEGAVPEAVAAPADATDDESAAPPQMAPVQGGASVADDDVDDGEIVDGVAPDADRSRYSGDDVYVGSEPPEGFAIKANERSMKYHVPQSAGYERTHTEVWFSSEEAAQEAGFIRAQR